MLSRPLLDIKQEHFEDALMQNYSATIASTTAITTATSRNSKAA
jgi:hypothetical protein